MKKNFSAFLAAIFLAVFLFPLNVLAQDSSAGQTNAPVIKIENVSTSNAAVNSTNIVSEAPLEVKKDEEIKADDLGVKDSGVLPDKKVRYFFKDAWRGINLALTRDPLKKAEKRLQYADERLIEAQSLVDRAGGEKAQKFLDKALDRYQNDVDKLSEKVEDFKEIKNEKVDKFVDKFTDHQFKQQKILQKLEEKLPEKVFSKVEEVRENSLKNFGEVINKLVDKEKVTEKIDAVLKKEEGSEFKHFKDVEILKDLKDKAPQEIKEAIKKSEEGALKLFHDDLKLLKTEEREGKFKNYLDHISGNQARHLEILDDLEQKVNIDDQTRKELSLFKDKAAERFQEKIESFKDKENKERLFKHLKDGDPKDFKILKHLEKRLPKELSDEVQKASSEGIEKFKERFSKDPEALKKAEIFEKFKNSPDAVDLEVIQKLEASLPAEQKKFVEEVKAAGMRKIEEGIKKNDVKFLDKFIEPDTHSLGVLKDLKTKLSPAAQYGINQAIQNQTKRIEDHLQRIDQPGILEKIKSDFEENADLKKEFQQRNPLFFQKLEEREKTLGNGSLREVKKEEIKDKILKDQKNNIPAEKKKEIREEKKLDLPFNSGADGPMPLLKKPIIIQEKSEGMIKDIPEKNILPQPVIKPRIAPIEEFNKQGDKSIPLIPGAIERKEEAGESKAPVLPLKIIPVMPLETK